MTGNIPLPKLPQQEASRALPAGSTLETLLGQGWALWQTGRLTEAERTIRHVLQIRPDHFEALQLLSMVCSQLGNHTEALRHIDAALRIDADSAIAHNSRGNILASLKRFKDALASFERAIALEPDSSVVLSNQGNAHYELGQLQEALICYDKAIALDSGDAEAFYGRGCALGELERFDEAVTSYDKAIALRPDYVDAWSNRGVALEQLQRFEEALASYDEAIGLMPEFPEALCNRGNVLQQMGRFEEAVASYDRATAIKPEFAKAWCNRGTALDELKRFDEAFVSYEKALAFLPYAEQSNPTIGFLHIGKTGGTALRDVFERQYERTGFMAVHILGPRIHDMSFPRMCAEHPTFRALFFVRDPVLRFVSGFNSRLRQGRPRHNVPWDSRESIAFERFATANQLAESLSDSDPSLRAAAVEAMNGIMHVRDRLIRYLGSVAFLQNNRARIFYVGDVATLEQDACLLKRLLHIDEDIMLPTDDVAAHRSPATLDRSLTETAVHNLRQWYASDYEVYRWCQSFRQSTSASGRKAIQHELSFGPPQPS